MKREEMTYKLPEGWIEVHLGEILVLEYGKPLPKNNRIETGNYKVYGSNGIIGNHSSSLVDGFVIIIGRKGSVGKVQYEKEDCWPIDTTYYIKTSQSLDDIFVFYQLLSLNLGALDSSTAIPGINRNQVYNIRAKLPPLKEQHRIVSKIETLFSELDHAEKGLQNAKHQLGIYKQALLKSAFNGSVTAKWRAENEEKSAHEELETIKRIRKEKYNSEIQQGNKKKIKTDYNITFKQDEEIPTWANANLNNLIDINARIGWRGLTKKEYTTEGPLFLSVHSLNYGKNVVFKDANHITDARYEESPEIKLQVNDILLCKDGAGIGKVGIIKSLPDKATVNSSLLVINAREVFNPDFLYYFFSGPTMQELVNDKISGSAIPHLFQKDIKKFNLKVPPKEEQNEIVDVLESRFTLVENLEKSINDSLSKALFFRHSILNKAFEGKLVEQNPSDESAQVLLQKIKIEKEKYLQSKIKLEKLKPKKKRLMETKKTVLELLEEAKYPVSPQELWQKSIHEGDIESFYSEIKDIYSKLEEINKETEPLLNLKK